MIERTGRHVTGADNDRNMRSLASIYVADDRFFVLVILTTSMASTHLTMPSQSGRSSTSRMWGKSSPNSSNECGESVRCEHVKRAVPTSFGWQDDGKNVWGLLVSLVR